MRGGRREGLVCAPVSYLSPLGPAAAPGRLSHLSVAPGAHGTTHGGFHGQGLFRGRISHFITQGNSVMKMEVRGFMINTKRFGQFCIYMYFACASFFSPYLQLETIGLTYKRMWDIIEYRPTGDMRRFMWKRIGFSSKYIYIFCETRASVINQTLNCKMEFSSKGDLALCEDVNGRGSHEKAYFRVTFLKTRANICMRIITYL